MADAQWVLITGAARPTGLGYWTAKRLIADSSASVILSAKTQAAGAPGCRRNSTRGPRGKNTNVLLFCWVASYLYAGRPAASAQPHDCNHRQIMSFHAELFPGDATTPSETVRHLSFRNSRRGCREAGQGDGTPRARGRPRAGRHRPGEHRGRGDGGRARLRGPPGRPH